MLKIKVYIPLILILGLFSACDENIKETMNRREVVPPPGTGASGDFCTIIRNHAPFTITGRIQMKSRERVGFRLPREKSQKLCLSGELYGHDTVSLVLTNFLTVPLFSCYTQTIQPINIYASRQKEGWIYDATCNW